MADDAKRERWEQATAWPGIAASVVFLVCYSWTILQPGMPRAMSAVLVGMLGLVWVLFVVDYLVRLALAGDKRRFVRRNGVDLLSLLLPIARPFRLLTALRRIPLLRGDSPSHVRRRVLVVAGSFVVMFIYVISLAEFQVERFAPHSTIHSFGNALWWACVTMATVGYGDYYPVTVPGRLLAVVLMIGGIGIVGTASATIVSYLNEHTQQARRPRGRPGEAAQDRADEDDDRGS